jgi:flavin reductase (DIM6/NTAB) family NADH-FMN oxidoreductase RutF
MATVGDMEHSNIITIGWTGILASTPPKTYISVRPQRHSHSILREIGEFVINLPDTALAWAVDYCGIYTGAKVDKFAKCSLTKLASAKVAPPTIAECPIAIECRVCEVVEMGSHDVFIADIVSVSCRADIVDEDGRMRFDLADLLAYAHGEYYSLGEIVGRFGFSTDKKKKDTRVTEKANSGKAGKTKNTLSAKTGVKNGIKSPDVEERVAKSGEDTPFYKAVAKRQKPKPKSDKGAPHGKRHAKSDAK